MTFVYCGLPNPCIVQLPGTRIGDQSSEPNSSRVACSGLALILNCHWPLKFMNQGDCSRSSVKAPAADGNGISVARGGRVLRLGSCGISQVLSPPRYSNGRTEEEWLESKSLLAKSMLFHQWRQCLFPLSPFSLHRGVGVNQAFHIHLLSQLLRWQRGFDNADLSFLSRKHVEIIVRKPRV
jgi:hypothetical protein